MPDLTPDWRDNALCRDVDPELFFPISNTGPALLQIDEAKQLCRRCSVTEPCLQWALKSGQDAGIWGGFDEDERRKLKRDNVAANLPAVCGDDDAPLRDNVMALAGLADDVAARIQLNPGIQRVLELTSA